MALPIHFWKYTTIKETNGYQEVEMAQSEQKWIGQEPNASSVLEWQNILLVDFLEDQRTVKSTCYKSVLRKLAQALPEKCLGILKQDSVPTHSSCSHESEGRDTKSFGIHLIVLNWFFLTSFCFLILKHL